MRSSQPPASRQQAPQVPPASQAVESPWKEPPPASQVVCSRTEQVPSPTQQAPVTGGGQGPVEHSSVTSVVAPDGRLVEQLPHGTAPPEIVAAIRRWLTP